MENAEDSERRVAVKFGAALALGLILYAITFRTDDDPLFFLLALLAMSIGTTLQCALYPAPKSGKRFNWPRFVIAGAVSLAGIVATVIVTHFSPEKRNEVTALLVAPFILAVLAQALRRPV